MASLGRGRHLEISVALFLRPEAGIHERVTWSRPSRRAYSFVHDRELTGRSRSRTRFRISVVGARRKYALLHAGNLTGYVEREVLRACARTSGGKELALESRTRATTGSSRRPSRDRAYCGASKPFRRTAARRHTVVRLLRLFAITRFGRHSVSTTRNEDWHFTSVKPIVEGGFAPLAKRGGAVTAAQVAPYGFAADCIHSSSSTAP